MTETRNLVSVIIPTYNRAVVCARAVNSVLLQTHSNIEVIVVDDGSTDDTRKSIEGVDDRIKYFTQTNSGVSAARNRGLVEANGEFIAFLDSDDVWVPWKLEAQLSVLEHFPEVGMVWTDMKAVDRQGETLFESYLKVMYSAYEYFDREAHFRSSIDISEVWKNCPADISKKRCYVGNIFPWMFMGNLVHTSTVLLRRDRQTKVGFFDVDLLRSGEDYDFHFRTCRFGDVAYLDLSTVLYQIGAPDQLTDSKHKVWIAKNNLKTVTKMYSMAEGEISLPAKLVRKRFAESYSWLGLEMFEQDPITARRYLLKSLKLEAFQKRVAAFFILSFLPKRLIEKMRRKARRIMSLWL
jgi:glycosyltransferase involved in cell wall biosynthesis